MIVSIIAAMSNDRVIGWEGKLPWHIPADLARFRSLTMGHTVAMGTRTFAAIGHPLEGRRNIVVTRGNRKFAGCQAAHSLREVIEAVGDDDELFICGGAELYREAMALSQRIYLTVIHGSYPGDVYFPEVPPAFQEVHREERPDATPPLSFLVFEKVDQTGVGADGEELRRKGMEALQRKLYFLARRCFEQALSLTESAEMTSLLAYCIAKSQGDLPTAVRLAEKALQEEPGNLTFLLNLGRIQIIAGAKGKGLDTLRKGVQQGGGQEFLADLAKWGTRRPPPIRSLHRNHPFNKYLGILLYKLRLR